MANALSQLLWGEGYDSDDEVSKEGEESAEDDDPATSAITRPGQPKGQQRMSRSHRTGLAKIPNVVCAFHPAPFASPFYPLTDILEPI